MKRRADGPSGGPGGGSGSRSIRLRRGKGRRRCRHAARRAPLLSGSDFSTGAIHRRSAVVSGAGVARHGQADPAALARRLLDGRATGADGERREVERRGLLRDVGRGLRAALLLRPRRAALARRPPAVAARRVHGRGAVHAPLGAVLPAQARARGRGAAALQTAFYLLEGKFAYAEPLRLALQNLALGRPGFARRRPRRPAVWRRSVPTARPRRRVGSPSSRTRSRSSARCASTTGRSRGTRRASGRSTRTRSSTTTGPRTCRARSRPQGHPHLPGLAHPRRHQVRDAARRDFRAPTQFDVELYRGPPHGRSATSSALPHRGARRHGLVGAAHVRLDRDARGRRLRHRVLVHPPARILGAAPERSRGAARAARAEAGGRRGPAPGQRGARGCCAGSCAREAGAEGRRNRGTAGRPVAPERFPVLQALLAYLLAACGEEREAEIPAAELLERFPSVPADELEEHLSLLNLVNFGGGCYTVYAELRDGSVHVDKELWGTPSARRRA